MSVQLQNDGFDNLGLTGATNLMIEPPAIVELDEGHYSIDPSAIEATYPVGSSAPDDFEIGAFTWYYTKNTVKSGDESVQFDEFNLASHFTTGTPTWDDTKEYYKITSMTKVLYFGDNNCFGFGTRYERQSSSATTIRIQNENCMFGHFLSPSDGSAWTQVSNPWSPKKGGVLSNTPLLSDTPWAAPAAVNFKAPFSQTVVATGNLPTAPTTPNGGWYIVGAKYDDEDYIGVCGIVKNAEHVITRATIWFAEASYWNKKESKYNYVVNPDGTVSKAQNPNYVPSTETWGQTTLPSNAVVRNATYAFTVNGKPFGYASYKLTYADYIQCIAEWSNKWSSNYLNRPFTELISGAIDVAAGNPINSILKAHTLPVDSDLISVNHTTSAIPKVRSGGIDSTLSSDDKVIKDRVVSILYALAGVNRGSAWWDAWTNSQCSLFLPFVGMIPLKNENVLAQESLGVRYRIDVLTGDFFCVVENGSKGVIFNTSGNCSVPVVCAGGATIQERAFGMIGSAVRSGIQIAASASIGNVPGAVMGALNGVNNMAHSLQQNESYSELGGSGNLFSGLYNPVLIVRRPIPVSGNYGDVLGYMSGSVGKVSTAIPESGTGFLKVLGVDTRGISGATAAEKREIESLLKEGIWLD